MVRADSFGVARAPGEAPQRRSVTAAMDDPRRAREGAGSVLRRDQQTPSRSRALASEAASASRSSTRSRALTTVERQMSYGGLYWPRVQISGRKLATTDAPMRARRGASRRTGSPVGPVLCRIAAQPVPRSQRPIGETTKRIFDFLRSRDARMACPFCGGEDWHGWDERVALEHIPGGATVDRGTEAFPLTCANCGFIRLQSAHVLDDPRASRPSPPRA